MERCTAIGSIYHLHIKSAKFNFLNAPDTLNYSLCLAKKTHAFQSPIFLPDIVCVFHFNLRTQSPIKAGVNLKTEKIFKFFFWNYDSLFIGLTVIICSFAVFEVFPC